ncbi:MAG: BrnT family toxin [Acetobacteraceae bacterium]
MEIEYDPEKDAANLAKHGVPLALGAVVLETCIGEVTDGRRDYGEVRVNAFGLVAGRLFVCTYTIRNGTHRLISVRKASRQEQRTWLR